VNIQTPKQTLVVLFIAISLAAISLLTAACSRAPSDREAVDLALPSLRAFVPDIEKDDISILKSYQKDADTIVVLKAGGMICEMPLIESKNGWIGRGINCSGQFESPEKAEARRKKKVIAEITASIEETNRKSPFVSDRNMRHDKSEFDPETLTVRSYFTDHGSKQTAMSQKLLETVKETAMAENCNHLRYMMRNGVTVEHYVKDDDGNPVMQYIINNDVCNRYYR